MEAKAQQYQGEKDEVNPFCRINRLLTATERGLSLMANATSHNEALLDDDLQAQCGQDRLARCRLCDP